MFFTVRTVTSWNWRAWLRALCVAFVAWTVVGRSIAFSQDSGVSPPERFTLPECITIALKQHMAIQAQDSAVAAASSQEAIARSYYYPQVSFQARYTSLDQPRSVDIPTPVTGGLADVFSSSAAFFGAAQLGGGSAAANNALDHPDAPIYPGGPSFNSLKQAAKDALPASYRVNLLGQNFLTTQLLLVQPLWAGGRIRYRHEQATLATQAAQWDLAKIRQETAFNVARAYLANLFAEEMIRVAEGTAGRFSEIEKWTAGLIENGNEFATKADEHRVAALRYLAEGEKTGLQRARNRARVALRLAMGVPQDRAFDLFDDRLATDSGEVQLSELLEQALAHRPELAKAGLAVRLAELERGVAKADFHPEIGLFASFSTIHDDGNYLNPNRPDEWAAGVSGQIPLFAGGRRIAQTRQAESRQTQMSRVRQLLREIVAQEVQDAFLEYVEMRERFEFEKMAVQNARDAIDRYEEQYRAGVEDKDVPRYLQDLILTVSLRTAALVRYYQTVYSCNMALVRIRLVTASDEYQIPLQYDKVDRRTVDPPRGAASLGLRSE